MKYEITLNGRRYEIEVEVTTPMLLSEYQAFAPAAAPVAVPSVAPAAAPASPAPVAVGSGEQVTAPMPGNILKVNVNVGDKVAEGQVLVILEAMKMENEIMAPCAGTVTQLLVSRGTTVDTGAPMVIIG